MNTRDVDAIIGKNLKQIRQKRGLTQDALGGKIGVDGNVIAQIEGSIRGMGKNILTRLCNVLQVQPYEFYIDADTPVLTDPSEKEWNDLAREAKKYGIIEDIEQYGRFRLAAAKKDTKISDLKPRSRAVPIHFTPKMRRVLRLLEQAEKEGKFPEAWDIVEGHLKKQKRLG